MAATVAMTEWVLGPQRFDQRDALGSIFAVSDQLSGPGNLDNFIEACHDLDISTVTVFDNDKGSLPGSPPDTDKLYIIII